MKYLQIRHPPAFVSHVAGHHAQALGFDLALARRKEIIVANKSITLSVKEGREYQPITMSIRPDEKDRTAYTVKRDYLTLSAKIVHVKPTVITPGVEVERLSRPIVQLYKAVRMNYILAGGQQPFHDVGGVVDYIRIYPQNPVFIDEGPGQEMVPAARENCTSLQLPLRIPPRRARGNLAPEVSLPDAYSAV